MTTFAIIIWAITLVAAYVAGMVWESKSQERSRNNLLSQARMEAWQNLCSANSWKAVAQTYKLEIHKLARGLHRKQHKIDMLKTTLERVERDLGKLTRLADVPPAPAPEPQQELPSDVADLASPVRSADASRSNGIASRSSRSREEQQPVHVEDSFGL